MLVGARLDPQAKVGIELHFEITRGGRRDLPTKAVSSKPVDVGIRLEASLSDDEQETDYRPSFAQSPQNRLVFNYPSDTACDCWVSAHHDRG